MGDKAEGDGSGSAGILYLMRGLPSSGKSHRAIGLAGETGVVCETDAFFRVEPAGSKGTAGSGSEAMAEARHWNLARFARALEEGVSPIVVDRGNGLSPETARYATLALEKGYRVELREPDSPWWQEIRVLLKYREFTEPVLEVWAERLAQLSEGSHRISAETIRAHMRSWRHDLRVEEIIALGSPRIADRVTARVSDRPDPGANEATPEPAQPAATRRGC